MPTTKVEFSLAVQRALRRENLPFPVFCMALAIARSGGATIQSLADTNGVCYQTIDKHLHRNAALFVRVRNHGSADEIRLTSEATALIRKILESK